MGLFAKDELVRVLEELTKRMDAVRVRIEGGDAAGALAAILDARKTLAGPLASSLERVDGATVVTLMGADRARAYADLARLEARARAELGEDAASRRAAGRAAELDRALG